jgi:ABC-type multidrug transport system ATPase subunit
MKNELITLLGHNGAGKSTLLNILTRQLEPTAGSITLFGKDLEDCPTHRIIGVVPQFDLLWDELTIYEHLKMFFELKGLEPHLKSIETLL